MGIFMQIFGFVNTVFVTTIAIKDTKPSVEGKAKNVSKIFHFGIAFGLGISPLIINHIVNDTNII
jgi:hypothetical protein